MKQAADREIQLRALAAVAERRNRPKALPVIAAGALAVAIIVLLVGLGAARSAKAELEAEARRSSDVRRILTEMDAIRNDPSRRLDQSRFARDQQLLGKLERIGERLGLQNRVPLNESPARPLALDSKLAARTIRATLSDMSLDQAMIWINAALGEVEGLYVSNIEFTPTQGRGWVVNVDLSRVELKQ